MWEGNGLDGLSRSDSSTVKAQYLTKSQGSWISALMRLAISSGLAPEEIVFVFIGELDWVRG